MAKSKNLTVTMPDEREIAVTRVFEAPRRVVFDAFTKPEFVWRWLYGPADWPLVECAIDLKVGGALRYVWRHREHGDMGMVGVFREIAAPARTVHTELFDPDWTGGETLVTTVFEERDARTTVTTTVRYSSLAARDAALETDMLRGWSEAFDRLAQLLAPMPNRRRRQGAG